MDLNRASRAVMYVRMSTESQDYSTDHQRAILQEYAAAHSLPIVREYVDDGKSGLDIKRRAGLLSLMRDVQSPQPDFTHIIVFDISRWGRFQDIDEAAYHEHTCRRAGIEVVYCGEKFVDDRGPYASLLKSMKRVMAAEYSRELSEKVFIAQSRFIGMGFKQGGHAGYGLRRLALKACGTPRAVLQYGESKVAVTADRVILVWGPQNEVETVRGIYALYTKNRLSEAGIARLLNSEQIASEFGRPWTHSMVNSVLTNVKYCGALAYNRRSCRLSKPRTRNAQDKWVVNPAAVDPIIQHDAFELAQAERARRLKRYTAPELIALLQDCHDRHGKVNAKIIAADPAMPDPQLFVRKFGSLVRAYDAAGLPRSMTYAFVGTKMRLSVLRDQLMWRVEALIEAAGGTVERSLSPEGFVLNGTLVLRVAVAVPRNPRRGSRNWRIIGKPGVDFLITGRMESSTGEITDYFLISAADLAAGPIYLKASNLDQYASMRYDSLAGMFGNAVAAVPRTSC